MGHEQKQDVNILGATLTIRSRSGGLECSKIRGEAALPPVGASASKKSRCTRVFLAVIYAIVSHRKQ